MPLHIAPAIRFLEEVKESEGTIVTLDSPAVTLFKAAEIAGAKPKVVPLLTYYTVHGVYKAS